MDPDLPNASAQASPAEMAGSKGDSEAKARAEAHKAQGNEEYKKGDYAAAVAHYSRAIEEFPEEPSYYGNRAASRMMEGEWKPALDDALKATQLDPSFTKGYLRAGKCYVKLGDFVRAKMQYEKALGLEPNNADAKKELHLVTKVQSEIDQGKRLLDQGKYMEAVRAFAEVLAEVEASLPVMVLKARALLGLGQHDQASKIASLVLRQEPHNVEALFVRGKALFRSGSLDHAATHFAQALRLDPDFSPAREALKIVRAVERAKKDGNDAFSSGNYEAAIEFYTGALQADAKEETPTVRAQLFCNRAAALELLGKLEEAVQDCNRALSLDANYLKAYLRRARAYTRMERYEEAVRDYEQAKKLDPENTDVRHRLREAKLELKKSKRKDYYKLLGVPKDANDDQIKKAYRKLALQWHPDKHGHSPEAALKAEAMFKEVGEAFSVLSDAKKRQRYDMGADLDELEGGGGGFGGAEVDPSELFNMFFAGGHPGFGGGGGFPGGGGRRRGHQHFGF
jgi:DnaJ family protein C protein 7